MTYTGLLDANIIYPAPMRDLFLQLAVTDIFKARWTADIHQEWIEALMRNQPHRDRAALERTRDLMDSKVRDCLVTGYEALIPVIELPDPNDRHILAAAIVGRCDVIVTQNLKHFPEAVLSPYGIYVQHPDEFLCNHLNLAQGLFCGVVKKVRARLKNPPYTIEQYLDPDSFSRRRPSSSTRNLPLAIVFQPTVTAPNFNCLISSRGPRCYANGYQLTAQMKTC